MRKNFFYSLLCIASCFIISGCANGDIGLTFNEDGSIKQVLKSSIDSNNYMVQINLDDAKQLIAEKKKELQQEGYSVKSNGELDFTATKDYADINELKETKLNLFEPNSVKGTRGLMYKKGFLYDYYSMEVFMEMPKDFKEPDFNVNEDDLNMTLWDFGNNIWDYMEYRNQVQQYKAIVDAYEEGRKKSKVEFVLNIPYKADDSNATSVDNDGKTLKWNLKAAFLNNQDMIMNANFRIYHKKNIIAMSIIAGILLVAALMMIVWVVMKHPDKKNRNILLGTAVAIFIALAGTGVYVKMAIDNPPVLTAQDSISEGAVDNEATAANALSLKSNKGGSTEAQAAISKDTLLGSWVGDGGTLKVDEKNFGKEPYTVKDIKTSGDNVVMTIYLSGGKTVYTLTFGKNNPNQFTMRSISTGNSIEYKRKV